MSTHAIPLRTLYRSLLRELPPRPLLTTPRAPLHQRLRETFQQPTPQTAPVQSQTPQQQTQQTPTQPPQSQPPQKTRQETAQQQQTAEQYAAYLRAQRTYVMLIERYNPGMGMDEEERVRLTARRVGMDLPVEYEEGGEGKQ